MPFFLFNWEQLIVSFYWINFVSPNIFDIYPLSIKSDFCSCDLQSLSLIFRSPAQPATAAVTARRTSTRITVATVFLWITALACTVAKCSVPDSVWKPTARPGNACTSPAFLHVYWTMKLNLMLNDSHSASQHLWSGSVALRRWALSWEMPGLWKWTLPDFWL